MTDVWTAKHLVSIGLPQCRVVTEEDYQKLHAAALKVVEEEMSGVRVHPCDEHSEEVKARGMQPIYRELYEILKNGQK